VNDAFTGPATYAFNNADQIVSVTAPARGAQTTANYFEQILLRNKGKTQQSLNCWVDSGREIRAAFERQCLGDAEPLQIVSDYPHLATHTSH
jgi:hypothetical protein